MNLRNANVDDRTNVILGDQRLRVASTLRPRRLARISLGALAVSSRARRDLPVGVLLAAVSDSGTRRRARHSAGRAPTSRRFAPRESGSSASGMSPPCCGRTRATRRSRSSSSRESCPRCSSSRISGRKRALPYRRCSSCRALPSCRTSRRTNPTGCSSRPDSSRYSLRRVEFARVSAATTRHPRRASSCCGGSGFGSTSSRASPSSRAATCIGEISRRWTTTTRMARCPRGPAGTCSSCRIGSTRSTVVVTLVVELALVWAVFLPRRFRVVCCVVVTALQLGIIATANYAFLNYLVLVLGVLLLDDEVLARVRLKATASLAGPRGGLTISNTPSWRGCSTRRSRRFAVRCANAAGRAGAPPRAVQNREPIRPVRHA